MAGLHYKDELNKIFQEKIKNIIKWEYSNGEPYRLIINREKENVYREKV